MSWRILLPIVCLAFAPVWVAAQETEAIEDLSVAMAVTTESGLVYVDLEIGEGPATRKGDTVRVHYTGWFEDGSMFDSSRRRGETFSFRIGQRRVIKGWEEGVIGMRIGGKRRLTVPPKLGYGKQGFADVIPPNATLTFEIELIGFD